MYASRYHIVWGHAFVGDVGDGAEIPGMWNDGTEWENLLPWESTVTYFTLGLVVLFRAVTLPLCSPTLCRVVERGQGRDAPQSWRRGAGALRLHDVDDSPAGITTL